MSTNEPNPSALRRSLVIIIAVIVVGTMWFVWQSRNSANKTLDKADVVQTAQKKAESEAKADAYKGWKSYTWASQGVTFKYPGEWFVAENTGLGRLYIKNMQVDLAKDETPDNFEQVWLSHDVDEASTARETAIKAGESAYRQVNGAVASSITKVGSLNINAYEYKTVGGPTLEAYFTNKAGTRLMATTSTEVGDPNQTDMVATLKKLLVSVIVQ